MQINKPSGERSKLRHVQWGLIRFSWLLLVSLLLSPTWNNLLPVVANNTNAEVTTSTSNHLHAHYCVCQYCTCQSITVLEGNLWRLQSDVKISGDWTKMLEALAGFKWSLFWWFRERFCLELLVWPCCCELLIYWKLLFLYLDPQEFFHLAIYSSRYLREKKAERIRHDVSEWVSSTQRCWMWGKVWLIQGVHSSTRVFDVKDYRFLQFQGTMWGVFREGVGENCSVPARRFLDHKRKTVCPIF